MAFQSTTGLGTPTQIAVTGNEFAHQQVGLKLSLTGASFPATFQLSPSLLDAGGNLVTAGTAFVLSAAAAASSPAALVLSAAAAASGGNTVYTGTITGGGSNAYAGATFIVAGFDLTANNGTFTCSASSTTTLTLNNALGVADTHAATAQDQASVTIYTGTITGGGTNAFAGFSFVVAGFDLTPNNGTFYCTGSSTTTLTLTNPNGVADTHAATATQQDTVIYTFISYGSKNTVAGVTKAVATVSANGLVTAVAEGATVVEVSYPTFNNTVGSIVSSGNIMAGSPINKIFRDVSVHVVA